MYTVVKIFQIANAVQSENLIRSDAIESNVAMLQLSCKKEGSNLTFAKSWPLKNWSITVTGELPVSHLFKNIRVMNYLRDLITWNARIAAYIVSRTHKNTFSLIYE